MKVEHYLTQHTKKQNKTKLKMDYRPKYKAKYYKTPREKHRQNTL